MGLGRRVIINNHSSHLIKTHTKDQDYVSETNNLDGRINPHTSEKYGYFEYNRGHTGHITIALDSGDGMCQLALEEFSKMPDRTISTDHNIQIISEFDDSHYLITIEVFDN